MNNNKMILSDNVSLVFACPVFWDSFQLVKSCLCLPALSLPSLANQICLQGLAKWTVRTLNSSLMEGVLLLALKEAMV